LSEGEIEMSRSFFVSSLPHSPVQSRAARWRPSPQRCCASRQFEIDTLDPQQYADDPSFQVVMALFEPAYEWDYLSPTPKLLPLTAGGHARESRTAAGCGRSS
jgi:hypothetical protein